jgi:beta-glucanase (GH16 family)
MLGRADINKVNKFSRYAVTIEDEYITWFFDRVEVCQMPRFFAEAQMPLIDVAVGGSGGTPGEYNTGSGDMAVKGMQVWKVA